MKTILKPQKIIDVEKKIIQFFMSIDHERFNEKARKSFRDLSRQINLAAKKSNIKTLRKRDK